MNKLTSIGNLPFSYDDMRAELPAFAKLYEKRFIPDNVGGMSSAHLFLFWYMLNHLKPKVVVESGVLKGQGTWLIEQTVPDAELYCVDIDWSRRKYTSKKANYLTGDMTKHDWSALPKEDTLVFIDDHQNAVERVKFLKSQGFKHIIFEDNYYPNNVGDVYSLKLAFANEGYVPTRDVKYWINRVRGIRHDVHIKANNIDSVKLQSMIDVYHELPPIFRLEKTRWGQSTKGITPEPLLHEVTEPYHQTFLDEAKWYTWMCYVRLK